MRTDVLQSPAVSAPLPALEGRLARTFVSPTRLDRPAFLMGFPFGLAARAVNGPRDDAREPAPRASSLKRAWMQFLSFYRAITVDAVVYLLPAPQSRGLRDVGVTANLGVVLDHTDRDVAILSRLGSRLRRGETELGMTFFAAMGYEVEVAPRKFEGEAALKHLHDDVYIGGYGARSQRETYDWMERRFDMRIVKVALDAGGLDHLDCCVFPVTRDDTLVCVERFGGREIDELERHTNIIPVSADQCLSGICTSARLANTILNASDLPDLAAGSADYQRETRKNRRLESIAGRLGLEVSYFNLSEFLRRGARLSHLLMHLNRRSCAFA